MVRIIGLQRGVVVLGRHLLVVALLDLDSGGLEKDMEAAVFHIMKWCGLNMEKEE